MNKLRLLILGLAVSLTTAVLFLIRVPKVQAQTPAPTPTLTPIFIVIPTIRTPTPTLTPIFIVIPTIGTPTPTLTPIFIVIPPASTATPTPSLTPIFIVIPPAATATPIPTSPAAAPVVPVVVPTITVVPPTASPTSPPSAPPSPRPPLPSPAPSTAAPILPSREPREITNLDASDPDVMLVLGGVCLDENGNDTCDAGEAPVREVRISTVDGRSLALSDDLGQYALRARIGGAVSVIPPPGYRALSTTLPVNTRVDFILVADRVPATVVPAAPTPAPTLNTSLTARLSELFIYIVLGFLILLIILSNLRISAAIEGLRKTQLSIAEQTNRADMPARRAELEQRIQREWGLVAGQQVADLTGESILINNRMGITGVSAEPAPRFAVTDARGRKFIFTTSIGSLRSLSMIGWRDRVYRVTESGALSLAQALWDYVALYGELNIVVPRSSPWFMVVRDPAKARFDPIDSLKRWWSLQSVRRAVRNSAPWQPASTESSKVAAKHNPAPVPPVRAEMDIHPDATDEGAKRAMRVAARRAEVSRTALTEEITPISVDQPPPGQEGPA